MMVFAKKLPMRYLTQLEPDGLIDLFLDHPPNGMQTQLLSEVIPSFLTPFDLLTTTDAGFRKKIAHIPLFNHWRKWLTPMTCFIGTTVSEYVLFPNHLSVDAFIESLTPDFLAAYPFVIIKDIPEQSPLQSVSANQYAADITHQLRKNRWIEVEGQALAWVPVDYQSIEDYLSRFSKSRRKDFRRKLKGFSHVTIDVRHAGDEVFFDPKVIDLYYQLYLNVFEQSDIHFDLLSRAFFTALLQDKQQSAIIIHYYHQHQLVGYNICYVVNEMLVDKYIGFVYPLSKELNLYYLSWFYNLQYALEHGLKTYIAGWTDPAVKATLGAKFTFTKHLVHVRNPVLRTILKRLTSHFESDAKSLRDFQRDL